MKKWKWDFKWQIRSFCRRLLWWMQDFIEDPVQGILVIGSYLLLGLAFLFYVYQIIIH